jgi:colicin import membrane protein
MTTMETTSRDDQLGRAFTWSLVVHGAALFIILLKSLVFPGEPVMIAPALRVDVVGLPDLLKKDLSQVSKNLPPADLKEKLAEAAKDAKKIQPIPEPEAVKPDDMVMNPKKVEKKPDVNTKEKAKKLESALARIRSLERLKDSQETESKEEAIVIKGNQVSKGTSLSGAARENAQAGYYDQIREGLAQFWTLPPWLQRQKLSAMVQIRIDPAGRVLSTKFIRPSGNAQFDEAILSTIRESQPLPRPPKELSDSLASDGVIVGFPL